jgi:hypothetical protein
VSPNAILLGRAYGCLLHGVNQLDQLELRPNRHKQLIARAGQEQFFNARIGSAGLSIGPHIAEGLT